MYYVLCNGRLKFLPVFNATSDQFVTACIISNGINCPVLTNDWCLKRFCVSEKEGHICIFRIKFKEFNFAIFCTVWWCGHWCNQCCVWQWCSRKYLLLCRVRINLRSLVSRWYGIHIISLKNISKITSEIHFPYVLVSYFFTFNVFFLIFYSWFNKIRLDWKYIST